MSLTLRVEHVSKQYRIYDHPGDRLKETLSRGRWKCHREFWALSDVTFEIEPGTTTGIIGPNGSGKSTLLQIITGTLEPTHGSVWHDGRIAALLELGAGFNPEFTGLENVFMNASLMGLSRAETKRVLPEIERFAEIGDFIHQPVKTYSSGMYVRLAFATAVSTHPGILIVDEALSVGDAVFQHRCLRRIKEMQQNGTTILFVSHDTAAVKALCSRAILLKGGRIESDGKPTEVLNHYQKLIMEREEAYEEASAGTFSPSSDPQVPNAEAISLIASNPPHHNFRHGNGYAEILSAELTRADGGDADAVESGDRLMIRIRARILRDVEEPVIGFLIRDRHGINAYGANTEQKEVTLPGRTKDDVVEATFSFEAWLGTGLYNVSIAIHSIDGESYDWMDGVFFFTIISATRLEGIANLNATATARLLYSPVGGVTISDVEMKV
jgi:lipopolysaccharide transport system ATP-binding protein